MKQKVKLFFIISFITLFIFLLISFLRGGYITILGITGSSLSSIIGSIIYYFFTLFLLYKFKDKLAPLLILLAIFAGQSIIRLPIHIIDFNDTLGSFLEYLIHIFAILLGFISFKISKIPFKILFGIISLIFTIWMSVSVYAMWLHRINYGTFTGIIDEDKTYNCLFDSTDGKGLTLESFKGKYLILDCWNTYCGYCYDDFPLLQELCNHYNTNPDIQIFAFHNWLDEEDASTGNKVLKERGYSIPCVSIDMDNKILEEMGVRAYPTVLVFDKDSRLIYRGNIEGAIKLIHKLMDD